MRQSRGPVGYLRGTFEQLHAAECIQTGGEDHDYTLEQSRERHGQMFKALMVATAMNPCDGCPVYRDGACKAFQQFHSSQITLRAAEQQRHTERARQFNSARRCRECGCRVRGKNHADGEHHKNKVRKLSAAK